MEIHKKPRLLLQGIFHSSKKTSSSLSLASEGPHVRLNASEAFSLGVS